MSGPRKFPARVVILWIATLAGGVGACTAPTPSPQPWQVGPPVDTAISNRAIAFMAERHARDPWNPVLAGRLADRYLQRFGVSADLADLERAETVARNIVPVSTNRSVAQARLSVILLSQHEFVGAFEAATAAYTADSTNASALGTLFDAALAVGRYDRAADALARMTRPSLIRDLRLARWATLLGDEANAEDRMRTACETLERSSHRAAVKAWCFAELAGLVADADSAATYLDRALAHQPGYRGAIEVLADVAYAERDWERALGYYRTIAVDAHPDLYLRLAEVHGFLGNTVAAERYEARFLRVAGDRQHEALFALPLALFLSADPHTRDEALQVVRRDLARRQAAESYDVLSWIEYQRGQPEAALVASDRARRFGASTVTRDYVRALILTELGRESEASMLRDRIAGNEDALEPHAFRDWMVRPAG